MKTACYFYAIFGAVPIWCTALLGGPSWIAVPLMAVQVWCFGFWVGSEVGTRLGEES